MTQLGDDDAPFGTGHGPFLTGAFAPVTDEVVLDDLPVRGEVPADLVGVYLRNGPNPRVAPRGRYHPFDGDGMIYGAQFDRGRVVVRNRWVATDGLAAEAAAGEARFAGIMHTVPGSADAPLKDTANTDVLVHGGQALATWYLCGKPYALDPVTLEPRGVAPFAAGLRGAVSAHGKVDRHSGELMFFDYGHGDDGAYLRHGVVAADGRLTHHVDIAMPGPRLPHDMAITANHSILHDLPLVPDEAARRLGRHKLVFRPEQPTRFGVLPRHGAGTSIRWFEFAPCFVYHTVNAWEDGDEVVLVGCRYLPVADERGGIDAARTARVIAELHMNARLWCWRMNLRTGLAREHALDPDHNVEFPTMDTRRVGRPSRFAYLVDHHPTTLRWVGIRKLDTVTGACLGAWSDGPEVSWYSEPWFAPRDGASLGGDEDDGYVIAFHWDERERRQELQVFDARGIERGPVARIAVPRRIPAGFHAVWASPSELAPV
jgi:carotenoid cleavage dioxygenase-like enzyme